MNPTGATWKTVFRDGIAIITVFVVIVAYAAIGFIGVGLEYLFGAKVTFPGDWMTGLYGLASSGLGYLIGKRERPTQAEVSDPPLNI